MNELKLDIPLTASESSTMTIIGVANLSTRNPQALPEVSVMSYTLPSDSADLSSVLNDDAVRVGNSLLDARVPESAILRDDFQEI